jgi:glucose/arabinose dehydrogenase
MRSIVRVLPFVALAACNSAPASGQGPAQRSPTPASTAGVVRAVTVAEGLEHPWALAFLPDGRMLVTERPGRLRIVTPAGVLSEPVAGVPEVQARGQGGLLDVVLDPAYQTNSTIWLSYAEPSAEGTAGTSVARARLVLEGSGGRLTDVRVVYRQRPKLRGAGHFGSRIVFARDGTVFITQGDRQQYRDRAQDLEQGMGKIARINPDGSVPRDNPFVDRSGAQPEIWSYGHRNLQGAALHPETGRLWTVEHGARGGDELNHPEAGKNYGWPVITYGVDYSGARIGRGQAMEGMEQPVYYWDPVIAPSGMTFYTGERYPGWRGSLFIGSMTPGGLVRLVLENDRVVSEERYLGELRNRIRDVRQGPDGYLYLVTDHRDGRVLRVVPAR